MQEKDTRVDEEVAVIFFFQSGHPHLESLPLLFCTPQGLVGTST